jgi:hypothetical protein
MTGDSSQAETGKELSEESSGNTVTFFNDDPGGIEEMGRWLLLHIHVRQDVE